MIDLSDANKGLNYKIVCIFKENEDRLFSLGFELNEVVRVLDKTRTLLLIELKSTKIAIDKNICKSIMVKQL